MRYAWEWESELGRLPAAFRPWWPAVAQRLRSADYCWAQQVTLFLANSNHVAQRIRACYGRPSVVLHPPIDTSYWTPGAPESSRDYYLFAGRLVAYKQPEIALKAAELAGVPIVIAGSGPELRRLRRLGLSNTRFVEQPTRQQLRELYRGARALVFPGVEDFGMTLVEAQACGTPVLAFDRGGAREAVLDGLTGRLYRDQSVDSLAFEMRKLDPSLYSTADLLDHVRSFDSERFDVRLRRIIDAAIKGGSVRVASAADL
jgi:glycosyltransferase involved in cell wall biosynthesis